MAIPEVSVILPVYNSEKYISKAIESVLTQSFSNFELIVINDGSTDNSAKNILSYSDERIRYILNQKNEGLIYSLNRGIELAQAKYIARMDADDICMNKRLALQKQWLDEHPHTSIVACTIQFIDEYDRPQGFWDLDQRTTFYKQIKNTLPRENCIAHPSIMARSEVIKQYRYHQDQQYIEDYDLWLRLTTDGHILEKIPENLLLYRVHSTSVTAEYLKTKNFFFKHFNTKKKYLGRRIQLGKLNFFDTMVAIQMLLDLIRAMAKYIKNQFISRT